MRPDHPLRGNPTVNFHGETRKNDTHASTTDPEAQLYRKARERAKLAYLGIDMRSRVTFLSAC